MPPSTPNFNRLHPLYKERFSDWQEAYDFYRGGRHVLNPGRAIGTIDFLAQSNKPVEDGSQSRDDRFRGVEVESYLYSAGPREAWPEYSQRSQRVVHLPLFRHVVDVYTAAALVREPDRSSGIEGQVDPVWTDYWKNVDCRGTDIGAFNRQALAKALTFGLCFAVTDKQPAAGPAVTAAQQASQGVRAYTYLVSPLNVINWRLDPKTGKFVWVVINEPLPDNRDPGEGFDETVKRQVRVWTATEWRVWQEVAGNNGAGSTVWVEKESGPHTVGEVPVSILFSRQTQDNRQSLDVQSPLAGLPRVDRSLMFMLSLMHDLITKQAFAWVFLPDDESGAPGSPIDVGTGIAIGYNSANGAPIMLSPESSLILAHWTAIANQVAMHKELSGLGRGRAESSREERSGEALLVETRNESNAVTALVEAVEDFDHDNHRFVAAWEGLELVPESEFTREVSLKSLGQQLSEAKAFKDLSLPFSAMKELMKPLLVEHMRQLGRSTESITKAVKFIDLMPEPVIPAALAPPGDADDADPLKPVSQDDE